MKMKNPVLLRRRVTPLMNTIDFEEFTNNLVLYKYLREIQEDVQVFPDKLI